MSSLTDGCFAIWEPLPTGLDAASLAGVLGASFACVLWPNQVDEKAKNTYSRGLLHFVDTETANSACEIVRTAFPRKCDDGRGPLVYRPLNIRKVSQKDWMAALESQNKRRPNPNFLDEAFDAGPGWSSSTDGSIASLMRDVWLRIEQTDKHRPSTRDVDETINIPILNEASMIAKCRPIEDVGWPRHHATGKWSFPQLRLKLATASQPEEFWALFRERSGMIMAPADDRGRPFPLSPNWRSLWDGMYILEEAVRRGYKIHPGFLDCQQKVEHTVRNGSALAGFLSADSSIAGESDAELAGENDVFSIGKLKIRDLALVLQQDDYNLWMRVKAMQDGFPALCTVSAADAFPLQLHTYLGKAPALLRSLLEDVEPGIQQAIMERGLPVTTDSKTLNRLRNMIQHGAYTQTGLSSLSLAALQQLFAKVNNAELRQYYGQQSWVGLRDRAGMVGIRLTTEDKATTETIRQRLAIVDRRWVDARRVHLANVTVREFRTMEDVDAVLHEQFGCLSRDDAKKYLQTRRDFSGNIEYIESSPGRGTPRVRCRKKLKGLVPNRMMSGLLSDLRSASRSDYKNAAEKAESKKVVLAKLQQKWKSLDVDEYRLVSLLVGISVKGQVNIDDNTAFRDLLRREQLHYSLTTSAGESKTLCRTLGLRVKERRHYTDYLDSVKKFEVARMEALEEIQAMDRPSPAQCAFCEKNDVYTENLRRKYGRMKKKALLKECNARQLANIDPECSADKLRSTLRASDAAFDEHFPHDERIADLPAKRLRALAPLVGVRQSRDGISQTKDVIADNLLTFAARRRQMATCSDLALDD